MATPEGEVDYWAVPGEVGSGEALWTLPTRDAADTQAPAEAEMSGLRDVGALLSMPMPG